MIADPTTGGEGAGATSHYSPDAGGGASTTLASTPRSRSMAVEDTGIAGPQASFAWTNGFSYSYRGVKGGGGGGGNTSRMVTRGAGGTSSSTTSRRPSRRWSVPWGRKIIGLSGSGRGSGGMNSATPYSLPSSPAQDGDGGAGDDLGPSQAHRTRLRSRGGKEGKPGARRRVRWGRFIAASLALICVLTALWLAVGFVPGSAVRVPSELAAGASRLQLIFFGQGEGEGDDTRILGGGGLGEQREPETR